MFKANQPLLIYIKVPSRHLALSTRQKSNEEMTTESDSCEVSAIPIVDHDPVAAYVNQLVSCYSHLANFYYDRCVDSCSKKFVALIFFRFGGTVVAVKLKSGPEKVLNACVFLLSKTSSVSKFWIFLYAFDY